MNPILPNAASGNSPPSAVSRTTPSTLSKTIQNPFFQGAILGVLEPYCMHWTNIWKISKQLKVSYPTTVAGWFQGVTYSARAMVPFFMAMQFVNQEGTKWLKKRNNGQLSSIHRLFIASFAALAGTMATNPVDTILVQLKARGASSLPGVAKTVYSEAGLPGFYRLVPLTFLRNFPYAVGIQVVTPTLNPYVYEYLPGCIKSSTKTIVATAITAVTVGTVFGFATHHFDVVRTRLFSRPTSERVGVKKVLDMYRSIWMQNGIRGFSSGMAPRLMRQGLGSGVVALFLAKCNNFSNQE